MRGKKIFLTMMETQALHQSHSRRGFARLNLSDGTPKILYILRENPGYVQKDLADRCKVKPSTMTVLLDRLEAEGLIYRETTHVSGGKSAKCVYLTEEGKKQAEDVEELMDGLEELSFKGFTDEEREQLFSLLNRVAKNLS